ncbi:hypothetical protein KC349_g113 [Hortaea werneckii]|nr:hypothetical protein KC349_g113 [Hortaea werneckii]
MEADKDNANPTIINPSDLPSRRRSAPTKKRPGVFDALAPAYPSLAEPLSSPEASSDSDASDDEDREEIDEQEVYDLISTISDPEHPLSLGSLGVVKLDDIAIFPPTSPRSRISTSRCDSSTPSRQDFGSTCESRKVPRGRSNGESITCKRRQHNAGHVRIKRSCGCNIRTAVEAARRNTWFEVLKRKAFRGTPLGIMWRHQRRICNLSWSRRRRYRRTGSCWPILIRTACRSDVSVSLVGSYLRRTFRWLVDRRWFCRGGVRWRWMFVLVHAIGCARLLVVSCFGGVRSICSANHPTVV